MRVPNAAHGAPGHAQPTYRGSLAAVSTRDGTQRVVPGITTHVHAAHVLRATIPPHARTTVVPAPPHRRRELRGVNSALWIEGAGVNWVYVGKLQDVYDLQQRLETGRDEMIRATSFVESHRANVRAAPPRAPTVTPRCALLCKQRKALVLAAVAAAVCACGVFVM